MDTSIIIEILLGLLAISLGVGGFLGASRANKAQAKARADEAAVRAEDVDQQAYAQARAIYESAIQTLRAQIADLTKETEKLRKANQELSDEVIRLRMSHAQVEMELARWRKELGKDQRDG